MSSTITDRVGFAGAGGLPREFKDFVQDYSADPSGLTPSDDAWDAAVADGGLIFVPVGIYLFNTNKTVSSQNALIFEGEAVGAGGGEGGTIFRFSSTVGNCITFNNCQHCGLERIRFKPAVRRTAGWDVKWTGGSFDCFMYDCRHEFIYNAVWVHSATEFNLHNPVIRQPYGNQPFLYGQGATLSEASYRCVVVNLQCDSPYNNSVEVAQVSTHASTTAFSLGDTIREASGFYECTTAGTTGSSTPPTAPGGTTAVEGFSTEVMDGSVGWTFRGHAELTWVTWDSYGFSLIIDKAAVINGWLGFRSVDTTAAASDASIPKFLWLYGFEADHNWLYGVILSNGAHVYSTGLWVSSALTGNGMVLDSTLIGDVQIQTGRIFGCAEHGVLVEGSINWLLSGLTITANSQKTSDFYHGIALGLNVERGRIVNCTTVNTDGGSNPQAYGILANSGIDNLIITDNDLTDNTSGATSGIVASGTILFNNNLL